MGKIEVTTYPDKCLIIENLLNKKNFQYQRISGKTYEDMDLYRYIIIVPDNLAESVVDTLSKIVDIRLRDITILHTKAEATVSHYFQELAESITKSKSSSKLIEELFPKTEPFLKLRKDLLSMVVIASLVSLVGLYNDSPSVIIGAMLISPLLGPITAFSFNTAIGNSKKMISSFLVGFVLLVSITAASTTATAISINFFELEITDEITNRTIISPVNVLVAIILGIAGGIAMISVIPGILVGVAIAAAIVPPAAVAGIGIAFLNFEMMFGATMLTMSTLIGLVLGCMTVFFLKGITPRAYHKRKSTKKYFLIVITIFAIFASILSFLSGLI